MLKWFGRIAALVVLLIAAGIALGYRADTNADAMIKKYASRESERVELEPGLFVHVRDEGKADGPAMILIHGSNSSLHTWEGWVKALGDRYRIITLDLPGHGLTGADPQGDVSNAHYVRLIGALMDQRKLDRAIIGGNSMGGAVAWQFAIAQPQRVQALLLLNAGGAAIKRDQAPPLAFRLMAQPGVRDLARVITPRFIIENGVKGSYANPAKVTPKLVDRYWELLRFPGNREATVARFAAYGRAKPTDPAALAAIKAPTLIMWGKEDQVLPVAGADWFAQAIPGSHKMIYDKVGHLPMEEIPEKSAADAAAWLATVSAKRP